LHIVFIAAECVPFAKTGGLGDVVGALPQALVALGHNVTVYLPRYRNMRQLGGEPVAENLRVPFSFGDRFCSVIDGGKKNGVQHYFIEHDWYFDRDAIYGDYGDNDERFYMLSHAAIEATRYLGRADVFHVHDWHTSLVPVLLRTQFGRDPEFAQTPCVLTIHNMGYQGVFDESILPKLCLPWELFTQHRMEFFGGVNLLKGGLVFSDFVTAVSPRYAYEIQTREGGFQLDPVVRARSGSVAGILNGVDYNEWNPASDRHITTNYTPIDMSGKEKCKRELLDIFGLQNADTQFPIIGIVSRLVGQKGFDLFAQVASRLAHEPVRVVALGSGEPQLEEFFRQCAWQFPGRFLTYIGYDTALSHKIEAGADMFLMPSRYEPCGLNQIYSLKYGTVPIVRAVGGLDDTVQQYDPIHGSGTGFKFQNFHPDALYDSIRTAIHYYGHKDHWQRIQQNGMAMDYSWHRSAKIYSDVYEHVVRVRRSMM